jgi:hypothetical protein
VGSGSPGTGSRLSGSGFEALGQRSGGLGSHLEDSTSLWCWSYGITLSSQTETRQTCCLWCLQRKLLLDFLYAFCDIAARVLSVSGPGEIAVSGRAVRNRSLSLRRADNSLLRKGIAPSQPLAQYARRCRGCALFISIHSTKNFWSNGVTPGKRPDIAPWLGLASEYVRSSRIVKDPGSGIGPKVRRVTSSANSLRPRTRNFFSNADRWNFTVLSDTCSEPAISLFAKLRMTPLSTSS